MDNWKKKVVDMRNNNSTYKEIVDELKSEFPNLTPKQIENKIYYLINKTNWKRYKTDKKSKTTDNINKTVSIERKKDGTEIYEGIINLMENEEITPNKIMKAYKLDPNLWNVISYKSNFWNAQKKGGEKILLYQTKIAVTPKKEVSIDLNTIDNYMKNKNYSKDKLPSECYNYDNSGDIIEIDVPDIHIGLLSWDKESGANYDIKIAKRNFFSCINDVRDRCANKKISKIVLVSLGDFLHIDNNHQETTNGTFQQADGRIEKIVEAAEDMLIDGISILGEIAPVNVIYISGNHDRTTGYMLMRSVMNVFRRDKNISFDINPNPTKARLLGVTLVGWTHGDMSKKMNDGWIQNDYRKEFGNSLFCEIHSGHYHSQSVIESNTGVVIRYLPKLCNASYWENQNGYRSCKAIVCFRWNIKYGLREIWFSNLLEGMDYNKSGGYND